MTQPPTIDYNPEIPSRAGFINVTPVPSDGTPKVPPLLPEDKDTLLHLAFFVVYTQAGRKLLTEHRPVAGDPNMTREKLTVSLRNSLTAQFPKLRLNVIDMLIEAHFEGYAYAKGIEAGKLPGSDEMQNLQARYIRQLSGLVAEGFQDGLGHEFSMNW